MRTLKILSIALLGGMLAMSCNSGTSKGNGDFSQEAVDSVSRAVGYSLASMVRQSNFGDLNNDLVIKAYKELMARENEPSQEEMMSWNNDITSFMQKKSVAEGERNLREGAAFLEDNKTKEGVVVLPSGLQYKIIREGNEVRANSSDTVEVHYLGTLIDGTEFDSSYSRNEMAKFPLDRVIPAWTEGMQLIGEGGKIILYVPSELGYGPNGAGAVIGPNSTLIFEVEMNKVFPSAN
ncbi:MAG: FKBP-type peptidyl-prolyl cis-trans isomerase [Bacteroidales bacterium]|jgi:FKBP-type peptidyl-prolyl cis-trans isomerase|nr:FKBP-type peptidyl-prolyl cis-trans isomerase [Bacteroidales bacterium]MDD3209266.1 FKBP-type peptidyl-prolyl cis-trans isomerase [Bacteroidales bacterium]MDD4168446.1 FKBP-type peptidyl-prolyl cis-trans isomerase [Bacteroidales bacterium]MDD5046450.1 FKBP-type peptidyl-prolyl cis-trans isomerase [Bacteroidales bacterium]MDD5517377.1 FKBP-type peptidyl-prolyl cis-trans isomerase [Bacteroidales bacterium]